MIMMTFFQKMNIFVVKKHKRHYPGVDPMTNGLKLIQFIGRTTFHCSFSEFSNSKKCWL